MSSGQEQTEKDRRRRRVRRLKKLILATIFCMIAIPVLCAVILGIRVSALQRQVEELTVQLQKYEAAASESEEADSPEQLAQEPERTDSEEPDKEKEIPSQEAQGEEMISVYLTFDDGPSTQTDRILDILKEYQVKATFFVIGKTDEASVKAYQRIVEEGHTLGMHSYSHQYAQVYASREAFEEDLTSLQEYLFSITGVESQFYRFPGGSSNKVSRVPMKELIQCLNEREITYFDWNISSGDASGTLLSSQEIVRNVMNGMQADRRNQIILFHDSAAKKTTVDALPEIIEQIQAMENTQLLPISDETVLIQHVSKES